MSDDISQHVEQLIGSEDSRASPPSSDLSTDLEPDQIALLLESLPRETRLECWDRVADAQRVEVLVEMRAEARTSLLKELDSAALDQLISDLDAETLIELAESLPDEVVDIALARMDERQRAHYEHSAQYAEDAIGRYVDHDLLILPQNSRVRDAQRLMRRQAPLFTEHLWLLDRTGRFASAVPVARLFGQPEHRPLVELGDPELPALLATRSLREACDEFEHAEVAALPVVDEDGLLLGRMTAGWRWNCCTNTTMAS